MADGVTTLGNGWSQAPIGTAEHALGELIAAGRLTGDPLCQALIARGNASRGPAYYPPDANGGPFYALGHPHNYAALNATRDAWDLVVDDLAMPQTDTDSSPAPAPAPDESAPTIATVNAGIDGLARALLAMRSDLLNTIAQAVDEVNARSDANTAKIQQQIDQAVKNAESSVRALEPVVAAALPALSGLFVKKSNG